MFSLTLAYFTSTDCSEVMSKRTQKDSGEERVTAKSKPMMNWARPQLRVTQDKRQQNRQGLETNVLSEEPGVDTLGNLHVR